MWGRAERQAAAGAGSLFARLGDPDERRAAGIAALERAIARLRGGEWSESLADLIARAGTLDAGADGVGLESAGAGGRESDAAAAIAAGKDSA